MASTTAKGSASVQSIVARLLVVAVLLVTVIIVYRYYSRPSPPEAPARLPYVLKWEEKARPIWESFAYTPLTDRAAVRAAITKAVGGSKLLAELEQAQRDNLVNVLTQMFTLLAARSPDEYLEGVKGLRRMPDSPLENTLLLGIYKGFTGQPVTADVSPRVIFEMLWKGKPGLPPRPIEFSFGSPDGHHFALGLWDGGAKDNFRDEGFGIAWQNPASGSMGDVTVPLEQPEDIIRRDGNVLRLTVRTAVRTPDKQCIPVGITLFWSTTANCWRWQRMSPLTDAHTYWAL